MKKLLLIVCVLVLAGCAELGTAIDIAGVILNDPKPIAPVCGPDTVGVSYQGETCLKWTDGTYRWAK